MTYAPIMQNDFRGMISRFDHMEFKLHGGATAYVLRAGGTPFIYLPDGDAVCWAPGNLGEVLREVDEAEASGTASPWNLGGYHLLMMPEEGTAECGAATYFYSRPGDRTTWSCQEGLQPKGFMMYGLKNGVACSKEARITEYRSGDSFDFSIMRHFFPALVAGDNPKGVRYRTRLAFHDEIASPDARWFEAWGLWRLPPLESRVIFPTARNGRLTVILENGLDGEYWQRVAEMGDNSMSIHARFEPGVMYKVGMPPRSLRQVDGHAVIMVLSPLENGDVRLVTTGFDNPPPRSLEGSNLSPERLAMLPEQLRGEGSIAHHYLGSSPTNPNESFLEVEGTGTLPAARGTGESRKRVSELSGYIDVVQGEEAAVARIAQRHGRLAGTPAVTF